jgi:hypothetical protein
MQSVRILAPSPESDVYEWPVIPRGGMHTHLTTSTHKHASEVSVIVGLSSRKSKCVDNVPSTKSRENLFSGSRVVTERKGNVDKRIFANCKYEFAYKVRLWDHHAVPISTLEPTDWFSRTLTIGDHSKLGISYSLQFITRRTHALVRWEDSTDT